METMNVNLNQQGMLAKLLAREDLTIQHGNYPTAFFDPKSRVLGLPVWKDTSKALYDLLVGHEVGHALYTPVEGIAQFTCECPTIPFDICNIVEDIRIERLVQGTYPGLSASFRSGYQSLAEKNFFGIKDKELSKLSFADRLNIHAKCGQNISIPMSGDELKIYDRCLTAKDFAEVIQICKDIAHLVGKKSEEVSPPGANKSDPADQAKGEPTEKSQAGEDEAEDDAKADAKDKAKDQAKADAKDKAKDQAKADAEDQAKADAEDQAKASDSNVTCTEDSAKSVNQELTSLTAKALEKAIASLVDTTNSTTQYFIPPSKECVRKLIVPYKELLKARCNRNGYAAAITSNGAVASIAKSKAAGKKYVSGLTREFEMRKCAHQHSRATVAKTGTLNMSRLHGYRYSEDIFKSITLLADAKNHGMIMFVDYSGSMASTLGHVLEHTVNLVMFCKSVGIPFAVYGFTNPHGPSLMPMQTHAATELNLAPLSLLEIFSSKMNKTYFSLAITQTLAQAYAYTTRNVHPGHLSAPQESLNGTPLNECVVAAHTIVAEFRKANRVEKMNVVFLSDGDGSGLGRHDSEHVSWRSTRQLKGILNGAEITIDSSANEFSILIQNLRKTTGSNVLGFYIPSSTGRAISKAFMSTKNVPSEMVLRTKYKSDGCLTIKDGFGYTEYYVLPTPANLAISDDDEFGSDIDVDAGNVKKSAGKLARAFIEFNDNKRTNRIILSKFAQAIA